MYLLTDSIPYDGPKTHEEIMEKLFEEAKIKHVRKPMIRTVVSVFWKRYAGGIASQMRLGHKIRIIDFLEFVPNKERKKRILQAKRETSMKRKEAQRIRRLRERE